MTAVRGAAQDVTDRKEREARLNRMLAATRGFVGVDDVEQLTGSVIEAVQEVFGYDIVSVRLHDPETDTLPPTAVSGGVERRLPSTPVYDADGDTAFARAFRADEPMVIADATETAGPDRGPLGSGMLVPLGDHGVLSVGATTVDAFDDANAALVELLGLAATAAFDRLERETERRQLRTVVEHVDETAFLIDEDGTFRYVTEPLADLLGRDRETLRGGAFGDVLAADADPVEPVAVAGDGAGATTVETRLRLADGGSRPVEIAVSATGTGDEATVAGVVTDITELAETRTDLAAERERFERLFETLPDPVAEVRTAPDGELRVTYANEAFARAVGVTPGPVDDRPLAALVGDRVDGADPPTPDADGPRGTDVRLRTTDGLRDYLRRTVPFGDDSGPELWAEAGARAFITWTDVTEGRERERYLAVLNRVLRHNLRNDLTVVLALADRLAEGVTDDDLAARARELVVKAEEMSTLGEKARRIERVLDGEARSEPVDLVPLLEDITAELGARHPGVTVGTDVPETLWARGGPDVRRAVAELLENALEDEAAGVVRVGARTGPDGDHVEIRVTDDGAPIPDDEWAVVSGETEVTQLSHGSGLGLWLVRWIVESHGGSMRREPGTDGATVVLELPAVSPPDDEPPGPGSRD